MSRGTLSPRSRSARSTRIVRELLPTTSAVAGLLPLSSRSTAASTGAYGMRTQAMSPSSRGARRLAEPQAVASAVRVGAQRDVTRLRVEVAHAQLRVAAEAAGGQER